MTTQNKVIRDNLRAAIDADARFADFSKVGIWDKKINADALPALGLGTPRWNPELDDTLDSSERSLTLIIVVKRTEGELEDLADEDSEALETLVCGLLDTDEQEVALQECTYQEDTSGGQSVATLSMMFVIKNWPLNS